MKALTWIRLTTIVSIVLPTGQILLTDFSDGIELYNPTNTVASRLLQRVIAPFVLFTPHELARGARIRYPASASMA